MFVGDRTTASISLASAAAVAPHKARKNRLKLHLHSKLANDVHIYGIIELQLNRYIKLSERFRYQVMPNSIHITKRNKTVCVSRQWALSLF